MAVIHTILELADDAGKPTGKFEHVSYSDEARDPIYTKLLDKTYDSRAAAENCPEARDALDRIFHRGAYAPHDERNDVIKQLGQALAKARRVARLWANDPASMAHPDWTARQHDMSAVDAAIGTFFGWKSDNGLLTDAELETRNIDPDANATGGGDGR